MGVLHHPVLVAAVGPDDPQPDRHLEHVVGLDLLQPHGDARAVAMRADLVGEPIPRVALAVDPALEEVFQIAPGHVLHGRLQILGDGRLVGEAFPGTGPARRRSRRHPGYPRSMCTTQLALL